MPASYPFFVPACLLAGVFFTGTATAGLSGRLDTLMQVDNRAFADQGQIEGRGDLLFVDDERGFRSGLSLALRHRDGDNSAHLYQLFVEKRVLKSFIPEQQFHVRAGRLQRADGLGFYTLDGAQLRLQGQRLGVNAYAGRPARIEDFRGLSAQALYGADAHYSIPAQAGMGPGTLRLGWQRRVDDRAVDRINAGWRTSAGRASVASLLQGTYLPAERRLENVQAYVEGNVSEKSFARMRFETYTPSHARLSFRQRFYAHYALNGQMALSGEWHYRLRHNLGGQLRLRHVWREDSQGDHANNGDGISLDASGRRPRGQTWAVQLDHLRLHDDQNTGLYFQYGASLSAKRRSIVSGVMQFQQRRLIGKNHVLGLEAQAEQAMRADLYASCFVSFIYNSNLQNEYRAGVRLSYLFDNRGLRILP
ncbi:MAG: hypothetical protein L3J88_09410 [Gammaproteobacteria bacterium]|nr:hypothetical protein [Gammaproteobacteria bacterium]MCF6363540.1 hypothetical protein [Gammaproteobacteria bacterium]